MPSSQTSSGYWVGRRNELLAQMEADEGALSERLAALYESEARKLEREIAAYYQQYGENNVIEYRRLLRDLPEADRRLLIERMDEFARKYPQYAHLMPVRESIYRLNELEGIQTAIRLQQLEIGAIEQKELDEHFQKQAQLAANFAAEEMGFGSNFYNVNAPVVAATVGAAWASGGDYSERIWANREKLAAYLNDDFAKLVARGASYDKVAREMSERFENVSLRDIKRLVFTEGTFLFNETQRQVFKEDFGMYRIVCADSKACPVCRELQAEQKRNPVRLEDAKPGVNFPPMHPWCRCSHVPVVEDWDAWIDDYIARHGGDAITPPIAEAAREEGE